jgi:sialate O-acetylesterase
MMISSRARFGHQDLLLIAVCLFAVAFVGQARGDVKLADIFGDHMVLQEGAKLPIWGTADPGDKITVTFGGASASADAAADGTWRVELPPVAENATPQTLTAAGKTTVTLQDVLVGDVWFASGQSNMDFGINNDAKGPETVAAANEPQIRLFMVTKQLSLQPKTTMAKPIPGNLDGVWQVCTPATLGGKWGWNGFSALAYYFGHEIHHHYNRPVGMIQAAWGGTQVAAWTSIPALEKNPIMAPYVEAHQKRVENFAQASIDYPIAAKAGAAAYKAWNEQYGIPFQKEMDQWNIDLKAAVAAGQPAPKKPVLAVPKPKGMSPPDGWIYGAGNLFNGMVAPLIPFAIKGVIWLQGENDRGNAKEYFTSFPGMIADWREHWGEGDFPFLYVQLANGNPPQPKRPVEGYSVMVRDAQWKTLSVPNTGMAVAIDIGSSLDIHFKDKYDAGQRLALAARRVAYGEKDLVAYGPLYDSMKIEDGGKVRISFKEIGSGLVLKTPAWMIAEAPSEVAENGKELKGFAIAREDRKFVWAKAVIDGNTVVVSADGILDPASVRYDWQDCPPGNLANKEGLPAAPFRTDDWDDTRPPGWKPPVPAAPAPAAAASPAPAGATATP